MTGMIRRFCSVISHENKWIVVNGNSKIEIVYEDRSLIVVNKPNNMLTQGDKSNDMSLLSIIKEYRRIREKKVGEAWLGLIHRIDKCVSGLVVFAKNSKAASRLSHQFREKAVKKQYLALVEDNRNLIHQKSEFVKLTNYLEINPDSYFTKVHTSNNGSGSLHLASLYYKYLGFYHQKDMKLPCLLVDISQGGGKKHQIRAMLAHSGHPISMDLKYGSKYSRNSKPDSSIFLHSYLLSFKHPISSEELIFKRLPDWDSNCSALNEQLLHSLLESDTHNQL